jgi:hypothetical protein
VSLPQMKPAPANLRRQIVAVPDLVGGGTRRGLEIRRGRRISAGVGDK